MRLCQPYFRALARNFAVVSLLSGVMMALALVAAAALAQIIDARLAHATVAELLPHLAVIAIAVAGAMLVRLARDTLLNRRRIWLEHGLGEAIVAHELWLGADNRHRLRSRAAVSTLARFTGSPLAAALAEAPWALFVVAGLWSIHLNIAVVASVALLLLFALAVFGSRVTDTALQFDLATTADANGQSVLQRAYAHTGASVDHARQVAAQWESTQRAHMAVTYRGLQRQGLRQAFVHLIVATATGAMAFAAGSGTDAAKVSTGGLVATCLVAFCALLVVSQWAIDAPIVARARAARRQLATLRAARTRAGEARLPVIARPDLRAPLAAGFFATAATAAALTAAVVHWQLPVGWILRERLAMVTPTLPTAREAFAFSSASPLGDADEIKNLGAQLAGYRMRLTELQHDAEKLGRTDTVEPQANSLRAIEASASALTASMHAIIGRLAELERPVADAPGTSVATSPRTLPPSAAKDVS